MLFANFDWTRLLNPGIAWVWIAIVAVLVFGLTSLVAQFHQHRERMAMIERGMHPGELDEQKSDE